MPSEVAPVESSSGLAQPAAVAKPICDVQGCSSLRKYKSVKDPTKGGCGMEHLKMVQSAA